MDGGWVGPSAVTAEQIETGLSAGSNSELLERELALKLSTSISSGTVVDADVDADAEVKVEAEDRVPRAESRFQSV